MSKQIQRNGRLRWVFRICKDLGIDDPCFWMNSVSPTLVDQWIAFYTIPDENKSSDLINPEDALKALSNGR